MKPTEGLLRIIEILGLFILLSIVLDLLVWFIHNPYEVMRVFGWNP